MWLCLMGQRTMEHRRISTDTGLFPNQLELEFKQTNCSRGFSSSEPNTSLGEESRKPMGYRHSPGVALPPRVSTTAPTTGELRTSVRKRALGVKKKKKSLSFVSLLCARQTLLMSLAHLSLIRPLCRDVFVTPFHQQANRSLGS